MTPRSAYIMHDTSECFDDSKGGFFVVAGGICGASRKPT